MKVISEMDLHMEKEIIKTFKKPTQVNGEMIYDMDQVSKSSKIENEDTLVHSYLINIKEEENFMIKISFMKENLKQDYFKVRDSLNTKMEKSLKGLLKKIKEFLEDILSQMDLIMKVNLETICLMVMDSFIGQMV